MKLKILGVVMLTLVFTLFLFGAVAGAQAFRTGQSSTITSDETIDGSAFLAASTVDVAGTVNGDLYCAGQTVTISGNITGDILCAAQTINVTGKVAGNIRLAGQTITVGGDVAKNATLAGQTITIESQGKIGQDAIIAGQTATISGQVVRDSILCLNTATVNAPVGRNVTAYVGTLNLGANAVISGALDYTSPQELSKADGASVIGKVTYTQTKESMTAPTQAYSPLGAILWGLMLITSAIIFALLFPRILYDVTNESVASFPQALLAVLVGFVAGIVMPFALTLLALTVLGIPFAVVVLLAWFLILTLSGVFTAYYTGRIVLRRQRNAVLVMFIGAVVLSVLLLIPILNVLIVFLSVTYGSGAQLIKLRDIFARPKYEIPMATEKLVAK